MSKESQGVSVLPESECWKLLSSVAVGRLITSVEGQPAVFPVNFVVRDRAVLFQTAEGTKLVSTAINNQVLFEADDFDSAEGWSVIVNGTAQILDSDEGTAEAESAGLRSWTPTVKPHFVKIRSLRVTGRRFAFAGS